MSKSYLASFNEAFDRMMQKLAFHMCTLKGTAETATAPELQGFAERAYLREQSALLTRSLVFSLFAEVLGMRAALYRQKEQGHAVVRPRKPVRGPKRAEQTRRSTFESLQSSMLVERAPEEGFKGCCVLQAPETPTADAFVALLQQSKAILTLSDIQLLCELFCGIPGVYYAGMLDFSRMECGTYNFPCSASAKTDGASEHEIRTAGAEEALRKCTLAAFNLSDIDPATTGCLENVEHVFLINVQMRRVDLSAACKLRDVYCDCTMAVQEIVLHSALMAYNVTVHAGTRDFSRENFTIIIR